MCAVKKFDRDLEYLVLKMAEEVDEDIEWKLNELKRRLIHLHDERIVKINHSVMELVCSKQLILKGYDVQVERRLENKLVCDLYAEKGYGSLIVEVETGYIPPSHALDPSSYTLARIASKIIRYSACAERFALGVPPHYIVRYPKTLTVPPRCRKREKLKSIKRLCDKYYQNPPIRLNEIQYARIHGIYIIDVDHTRTQEVDPQAYLQSQE